MKVIGYLRVSTQEQAENGVGLDAQRRRIEQEAEVRGWEVRWVEDRGFSAKDLNRPGIRAALGALQSGEAEGLVVSKLDRLSRSMLDFPPMLARARSEGWALVALDVNVDTTTPEGKAMASVIAVFAELERDLIGKRIREALAVKREQGVRLGRPPLIPKETRDLIRAAREAGLTFDAVACELNAKNIPRACGGQWHAQAVRQVYVGQASKREARS